jgi:putative cofactor-binding repeat protein
MESLLAGKNPFAGAGDLGSFGKGVRPLNERMTDKVVRDRHIVTASTEAEGGVAQTVVDNQMIFVNQDNPDAGDGSFENPYQTLDQAAADEIRFQPGVWIYVFSSDGTADTYENTHFTLLDDMVLWGQGYQHPVYGLGGGPMPILDGGYSEVPVGANTADPVIWLANNNEIMGLIIQRGLEGIYVDTYRDGGTADSVRIHHNIIRDNLSPAASGSGIHISNIFDADDLGGKTLSYLINDNLIEDNQGVGIYLRHEANNGELVGTTFETVITGNTIDNHSSNAVFVSLYVDGSDPTLIQDVSVTNRIEDNLITGSARGIAVYNTLNARSNTEGLYVANLNSQINNTIRNNSISNYSGGYGIYIDNQINAQTYLNSLVRQARTSNLLENNVVSGKNTGIFVRNFSFSGDDFNDVTTETRLVGNNISVEEPLYTGTYGIFVSDEFHKNGDLAQGPISARVFGQANRINDLSTTAGRVTGVHLQTSTRTLGSADDYATLVSLDFGGGALSSTGGNSFTGFGTGEIALRNNSPLSATAENNWWGTTDAGLIAAMIEATAGGSVDYLPYLSAAP